MKMLKPLLALVAFAATVLTAAAEGEFRHIVMFKFKPTATPEQVREIEQAFAELPKKIDTIQDYEWGTSQSVEGLNDGFTHCFFLTFKDKAALDAYIPHEAHKAFAAKLGPLLDKVLVFDYSAKDKP